MEFQNGQPVLGAFLSEAIMDVMPQTTSPFNECAILATICGRSLFQAQQYSVRFVYGDMAPNWTDQHQWLDNVLTNRLQILSQHYPSPTQVCDPMLSFAHIMGQASVIHLYKGMESIVWAVNEGALVLEYRRRALSAAQEIVKQAKGLIEFYFFKVCHTALLLQLTWGMTIFTHRERTNYKTSRSILSCPSHYYSASNSSTVIEGQTRHLTRYFKSFYRFSVNSRILTIQLKAIYIF
ncbi:hypothetical protein N7453_010940 [Penicillium expansum]|nr:hypothetical protein N7453_010940 [Penicillium expansum]